VFSITSIKMSNHSRFCCSKRRWRSSQWYQPEFYDICNSFTPSQPVDVFWSYRVTVSARTAAGLLPSLARRPGTLSRIISGIWTLLWKRLLKTFLFSAYQCN